MSTWHERIKPYDYGAPEGVHAVQELGEDRHSDKPDEEKIRTSDVVELTLEHYETAFAFQKKIYDAFGITNTHELEKHFDPSKPLCAVPREWREPNYDELDRELTRLVMDKKIPSYMYKQFQIALDDLERRQRWVRALIDEATDSGKRSSHDSLARAYELVTGETNTNPNLVSLIVTPVSVHFLCGDKITADRLVTSSKRISASSDGSVAVRPITQAESAAIKPYLGMAMKRVARGGVDHVVTVGITNRFILRNDGRAKAIAFTTFRHELDHLLFGLREHMHSEQDRYAMSKYEEKVEQLHASIPSLEGEERDVAVKDLLDTASLYYYYQQVYIQELKGEYAKGNNAVNAANEFMSQYLDDGASYAQKRLQSEGYVNEHFPNGIEKECMLFVRDWLRNLDKKHNNSTSESLAAAIQSHPFRERILRLRNNQLSNAFMACFHLENLGFSRPEVADMLRMVPFNRWRAFSRRYGEPLAERAGKKQEQESRSEFEEIDIDEITDIMRSDTPLGKVLARIKKDLDERTHYDTFVYYTGGLVGVIRTKYAELKRVDPNNRERNKILDALLYYHACGALRPFKKDTAPVAITSIAREFGGRNHERGERNEVTEHAARILAHAIRREFPDEKRTVPELMEALFAYERR